LEDEVTAKLEEINRKVQSLETRLLGAEKTNDSLLTITTELQKPNKVDQLQQQLTEYMMSFDEKLKAAVKKAVLESPGPVPVATPPSTNRNNGNMSAFPGWIPILLLAATLFVPVVISFLVFVASYIPVVAV